MELTVGKDNELFCFAYYQEGDIKEFLRELDSIEENIRITSNSKDKDYEKISGLMITKLSMIATLLQGKKIEQNQNDLVDLGAYIQKIGKELEEYGKNHKQIDSEVKKSSDEEIIDKIINDIKELMKNWIQKQ